jgi:hypothetical protein
MYFSLYKFEFVFMGPIPDVYTQIPLRCTVVAHLLAWATAAGRTANVTIAVLVINGMEMAVTVQTLCVNTVQFPCVRNTENVI